MKALRLAMLLVLAATTTNCALGHGFRVSAVGGKLSLVSEDPSAGGLPIYKVQSLLGPSTFKSTDHPGFEAQSGITTGSHISFDVLGPLLYSNGGEPIPSPVDMTITPQDFNIAGSVTVTGSSSFQSGFLVGEYTGGGLGEFEHQLNYTINVPSGVPTGVYALAMQLTGVDAVGQPYATSDPFVAVFNNGMPVGNLPAIATQLYNAAVPEPSSVVLLALAGLGLIGVRHRRNRRA